MTRLEYMNRLEDLLSQLPMQERLEAIEFVEEYFDEADDDQSVIKKLGNPEDYAAGLLEEMKDMIPPAFPENGFIHEKKNPEIKSAGKMNRTLTWLLLILASPLIVMVGFVVIMLLFALFMLVFAILMFFGLLSVAGLMMVILEMYKAIVLFRADLLGALFDLGVVLIGFGIFILCGWLFLYLCKTMVPALFRKIQSSFYWMKSRIRRVFA